MSHTVTFNDDLQQQNTHEATCIENGPFFSCRLFDAI